MKLLGSATFALLCALTPTLTAAEFGTVPDPYVGNWAGTLFTHGVEKPLNATIIAYKNRYEVALRNEPDPRKAPIVVLSGRPDADQLVLESSQSPGRSRSGAESENDSPTRALRWQGRIANEHLSGTLAGSETGTFSLTKLPFLPSPTLGAKAPNDAEVLFAGSNLKAWESRQDPTEPIQWLITDSGDLEVVSARAGKRHKQDLTTKVTFSDYHLHLEFKLTHKPEATGQARSNSGVIHLGLYETQILDSFGLYGRDDECGGIYKIREPDRNVGYPAGLWQTYDIDFTAPRFDAAGKKTADARMTVRLNGIPVHQDVAVPKPTAGGKETAQGPIVLQDHGNPVQFRNIWVMRRRAHE